MESYPPCLEEKLYLSTALGFQLREVTNRLSQIFLPLNQSFPEYTLELPPPPKAATWAR